MKKNTSPGVNAAELATKSEETLPAAASQPDKTELLDELDAIKSLLEESETSAKLTDTDTRDTEVIGNGPLNLNIPILEDAVTGDEISTTEDSLLDLPQIFDDGELDQHELVIDRLRDAIHQASSLQPKETERPPLENIQPQGQQKKVPVSSSENTLARELLIQEIINDMMLEIEPRLRQRLSTLSDSELNLLAQAPGGDKTDVES